MKQRQGYIALVSVVLVMSAVLIVGAVITLVAANQLLIAFTADRGERSWYLADTCANEALLGIKRSGVAYVGSHSLTISSEASCTISATVTGGEVTAVAVGNFRNETYHTITVTATTSPFAVTNWHEGD